MTERASEASFSGAHARLDQPVVLIVDQLRRRVPGGIGTYIRGLLAGLSQLANEGLIDASAIDLYAGAGPSPDELTSFGFALECSRLDSRILARTWAMGWPRVGDGRHLVHTLSPAVPAGRGPLAVTMHDFAWRDVPQAYSTRARAWHERQLQLAKARSAHLVVPSEAIAREAVAAGIPAARVTVIEHGGDHLPAPDQATADQLLEGLGVKRPYLLSVGTLEPRKNLDRLIRAYSVARASDESLADLVVVGPTGWGVSIGDLPTGVHLAGQVEPAVLSALYRSALGLLYVPLKEGYGLPVLEAMASGLPVLSSDVPASCGATLLVDALDEQSIASGIAQLSSDASLRAELVIRGASIAATHTWRSSALAHYELWRSLGVA